MKRLLCVFLALMVLPTVLLGDGALVERDVALSKWYSEQSSAMDAIGLEEMIPDKVVRLNSYREVSKAAMKPEQVLENMQKALAEFRKDYKGEDRIGLLDEWADTQRSAAKALHDYLKATGDKKMVPVELKAASLEKLLEAQYYYLKRVEAMTGGKGD